MGTLRGHDDKVRVVLNKADQVDQQQLMRVYGALMWSLGKVFRSPEVCRVYIGRWGGCGGWGVGRAGSGRCGEEPGVGEHRRRGPKRRAPLSIPQPAPPPPAPLLPRSTPEPAPPSPPLCSFNASQPIRADVNPAGRGLFEREQEDLLHDLYEIPARSCDRRVNEFVKRVRCVRVLRAGAGAGAGAVSAGQNNRQCPAGGWRAGKPLGGRAGCCKAPSLPV